MKGICKSLDALPRLVKILLCLPIVDIVWAVYRIAEGIASKNVLHLVLGIVWVFFGTTLGWVLDLFSIIFTGRIFWFKA